MDFSFIKTVRKEKEMSLDELSIMTGIASNKLEAIELNEFLPAINEIEKIISVLNMKMVAVSKNYNFIKEYDCINGHKKHIKK